MSRDYCLAPWFTLYIGSTVVKPCCLWDNSKRWQTPDDIKDIWNSEEMQKIRENFLNGIMPKECKTCMKKITPRKIWLERLEKDLKEDRIVLNPPLKPLQVDFQLGSACNLQCRTCGSWGSSNWTEDDKKLSNINPDFKRESFPEYKLDVSKFKDCKEMFSDLVRFDFKGGEPMIQNSMIEMIENLVEWGNAPNIILAYVTNGSFINEKIAKLWNSFKEVRIVISLDGTNDLFSYLRGYDFDLLKKNLNVYDKIENLKGLYNPTVSIYNILDLAEINQWISTRHFKRFPCLDNGNYVSFDTNVIGPAYLDARILPKKHKQLAVERIYKYDHPNIPKISNWLKSIAELPPDEEQLRLFVLFTKEMDRKRGTDFLSIKPEFKDIFEEYS